MRVMIILALGALGLAGCAERSASYPPPYSSPYSYSDTGYYGSTAAPRSCSAAPGVVGGLGGAAAGGLLGNQFGKGSGKGVATGLGAIGGGLGGYAAGNSYAGC